MARSPLPTVRRGDDVSLTAGARALWGSVRDAHCVGCALSAGARTVCVLGNGPVPAEAAILSSTITVLDDALGLPNRRDASEQSHLDGDLDLAAARYLDGVLREQGVDLDAVYRTAAVRCLPIGSTKAQLAAAQRACERFTLAELARVRPRAVLALGAAAYFQATHREGITANRGRALRWAMGSAQLDLLSEGVLPHGCWVVPTLDPVEVLRYPRLHAALVADVGKWWRLARGESDAPVVDVIEVRTLADLAAAAVDLVSGPAAVRTFDLETRGFQSERAGYSKVWCAAVTAGRRNERGEIVVYGVPLEHPESPFRGEDLRTVVRTLADLLLAPGARVSGHNVKFDLRWLHQLADRYGVEVGV